MSCFVHDDQIKPTVGDSFGCDCHTVIIYYDKLCITLYYLRSLLCCTVSHVHLAVHSKSKQVFAPCGIHNRQGADHKNAIDAPLVHQKICCPDSTGGFACTLFVEAERTFVECQKPCCGFLVFEWLVFARPLILAFDGRRCVNVEILEYVGLVHTPVNDYTIT